MKCISHASSVLCQDCLCARTFTARRQQDTEVWRVSGHRSRSATQRDAQMSRDQREAGDQMFSGWHFNFKMRLQSSCLILRNLTGDAISEELACAFLMLESCQIWQH